MGRRVGEEVTSFLVQTIELEEDFSSLPCPRRIPNWLLLSGLRPCFCVLTTSPCLNPGSVPKSAFPYMTSFLCPGPRFKLLPRILLPKSALPALTQFLSPDHRNLHFYWVNKPKNLCDAFPLLPCHHPEEPKCSFLVPSQILKRGS
ncbi:hypothetical protein ATANTOWER_004415 [Ataeniobius toweri]|uniref:Uncharacterized protein n=1 Tax=Ataeniobius toweri TaxID=208326 RepID=A0ABU7CEJ8_9TELE|nr:hypothetical protein [Ataeniobius toweri]